MGKNKLYYVLDDRQQSEILKFLERTDSKNDLGGYALDFFKQCALNGIDNKKTWIDEGRISQSLINKEELVFNPDYTRKGAHILVLVLTGKVLLDGLKDLTKLQNAINRKEGKKTHKSFEAYLDSLFSDQTKILSTQNYTHSLDQEIEESKKILKEAKKNLK